MNPSSIFEEIYDCIVHTIQRRVIYHKKCMNDSQELLNLIDKVRSTTRPDNVVSISEPLSISDTSDVTHSRKDWDDFWSPSRDRELNEVNNIIKKEGYEYTPPTSHNRVTHLPTRY